MNKHMEIKNVDRTLEEVSQIQDIGQRLLYWNKFEKEFDKLDLKEQDNLRQKVEERARELIEETNVLLENVRSENL